jgi:hypothetical protein
MASKTTALKLLALSNRGINFEFTSELSKMAIVQAYVFF